jgi:putative holliday junction resolvase
MRALGLDWGTVRIGVAMSDEGQKLAFPLQHTLATKNALEEIRKLVEEYEVEKIVMGLPLSLSGDETQSTKKVRQFGDRLEKILNIKIDYFDERFSTVASTKSLHDQDIKEKDQRSIKDNIAAALLLQKYLEKKN